MKKTYYLLIQLSMIFLLSSIHELKAQNLKVFIMAGQSNMQGHGNTIPSNTSGTLSHFMNNGGTTEFGYILNSDGSWATRNDVWVRYDHENGDLLAGELNIGYGSDELQIGPELGFGHLLGMEMDDQVMIIKTCWGGKNLAVDFRPPSSGGATGPYYNLMINDITEAIANIQTEFPQYSGGQIEISGFSWFQGWNDGEEQSFLDEYEQNLINLIADVRTDLNTPNLPVVIGLTGNGGRVIEDTDGWINRLQTQLVPSQIRAVEFMGHTNVTFAETRDYWREGEQSPEPDFLHHWNNNAESYLRIGTALGQKMINMLTGSDGNTTSNSSLGTVIPNTNPVLPSSYNFQEYVFAEPNDQGNCLGIVNATATIDEVYIAQTHIHTLDHPLFFMIGHRPAVFQLAVTGSGASPDVTVEGKLNGTSLGTLCLDGPSVLSNTINSDRPNFDDFFSVTLPKAWVVNGLELEVTAGSDTRTISSAELKIGPYTELNLVEMKMDVLDYNIEPAQQTVIADQLGELASAIPASVIRYGTFPVTVPFPEFVVTNNTEQLVRMTSTEQLGEAGIPNEGHINYAASDYLQYIQAACGDYLNTVYFGNTLNLAPGGWGGNRGFVSPDYDDVFIHELGHALSLPHWGGDFNVPIESEDQYLYPYGGVTNDGGGIGETWTFIQDKYAFVSPRCEIASSGNEGLERSDCMQREIGCNELRGDEEGPWEGFSDFSAYSMYHYLVGGDVYQDQVPYKNGMVDFQVAFHDGFPTVSLENGERVFNREDTQPQNTEVEDWYQLPGEEQIEQDLYLLYGAIHPTQDQANVMYEPLKYKGILAPNIDPTDPVMFETLQNLSFEDSPSLSEDARDITLKLYYIDGSTKHVVVPYTSFDRDGNYFGLGRRDVSYFAVTVPGDINLCSVELYHRPLIIRDEDDNTEGNINYAPHNITAANYMDAAVLKASVDFSCNCPGSPNYIQPGTPCDDGNPLTIDDVEDGFCNCEGELVTPCGFINNGHFTDTIFGWWKWGGDVTIINNELAFDNIEEGDAGIAQGPFSLIENEIYQINFDAYAQSPRTIDVIVYLDEEPYIEYYRETIELENSLQNFEIQFTFNNVMTSNAAIEFSLVGNASPVFLDNICFDLACVATTEIVYNGIDDDCDPNTLDDDLDQDGFALDVDCNDNNATINPSAMDIPENGIDENCDGFDAIVLPVTFVSISGEVLDDEISITWEVANEVNVSQYIIEKSEGQSTAGFNILGSIEANGQNTYSFIDKQPINGFNYYRIITEDVDGQVNNSPIITIVYDGLMDIENYYAKHLVLSPNPVKDKIHLSIGKLIRIVDLNGREYPASLDVSRLSSGMYIAIIEGDDNFIVQKKFIKQ